MKSYAVCAVVTALTACSANPVDNIDIASVMGKSDKATTEKVIATKTAELKKAKASISTQEAQNKKKQIIAIGKAKQATTAKKRAVAVKKLAWKRPVVKKAVIAKPKRVVAKRVSAVLARAPQRAKLIVRQQQRTYRKVTAKPSLRYTVNRQPKAQYRQAVIRKSTVPQRRISRIDPDKSFGYALSSAAIDRAKHKVRYDGAYVKIGYPWGDVPKSIGVCTDVVIRAYRKLGIDLQQEVHRDISKDFYAYPNLTKWGLTKPDPNIDHRRVYNLQAFFKRHKAELPRSRNPRDYKPGDLVTWMVGPSFPHIGVVVNKPSIADPNRLMISHNIGYGPQVEDILFRFPMTGHYRYTLKNKQINPALHFTKTPAPASVQRQNTMNYNDLLEASRYLIGDGNKVSTQKNKKVLQVKQTQPNRINLAQLDPAALSALLKY